jgi:hypothetical protein
MLIFEVVQPVSQEMKNEKEVASHQNRIHRQFNGENSQTFDSLFFHQAEMRWGVKPLFAESADWVNDLEMNRVIVGVPACRFNDLTRQRLVRVARRLISSQIDCLGSVSS